MMVMMMMMMMSRRPMMVNVNAPGVYRSHRFGINYGDKSNAD